MNVHFEVEIDRGHGFEPVPLLAPVRARARLVALVPAEPDEGLRADPPDEYTVSAEVIAPGSGLRALRRLGTRAR